MSSRIEPVTLVGKHVELQPLGRAHAEDLSVAVGDMWQLVFTTVPKPEDVPKYIAAALADQEKGLAQPFAIVERSTGRAIGSTRFSNFRREHRSLEIGWTWINPAWQRTAVNTEAKYQLLQYAFEVLACVRVELKTDILNERSQRAIKRLGATQEGVFRRHMIMPNGRVRDTVYFSIVDTDWPSVKVRLQGMLAARDPR